MQPLTTIPQTSAHFRHDKIRNPTNSRLQITDVCRLMTNCLGELNYLTCLVYLDNVVIYSSTQEEHIKCLQAVLKHFWLHGLKLKPSKCEFFKEKIEYLGHSVSLKSIWPSRDPLHEYARGDTTKKKKEQVVLNEAARNAFHQLKKAVMSAPVLTYPDPNKEYLLEMDDSKLGLRAMLSQKQSDGRYNPVALGSRALHGVEVNYHSMTLEFLAMKWSIKHFQTYLLGRHFKVCTDNNPLTYFLISPNMDAMKQRWINELARCDFSLEYQKG